MFPRKASRITELPIEKGAADMEQWKHLSIATTILLAWPFVNSLVGFVVTIPFWISALLLNSVSFWLVFSCPERPLLNAALYLLAFSLFAVFVGLIEVVFPGADRISFSSAVGMVLAAGLLTLVPGLVVGLLLRWVWR